MGDNGRPQDTDIVRLRFYRNDKVIKVAGYHDTLIPVSLIPPLATHFTVDYTIADGEQPVSVVVIAHHLSKVKGATG